MKVLIILGSPRKKGNSDLLISKVTEGVEEAGGTNEIIRLEGLEIHPCLGCGGCEKEGKCVIQDDMQEMYKKIDNADRIIIASPIYFYSVTAQTKAFVDRCQAMWSRKYILNKRLKQDVEKIGYLVSVAATKGERVFESAILTVRYALDAMDFKYGGEYVVRGADKKGAILEMPDVLEQAKEFGKKVVRN
ncbi:MAG: flavodoxin family protein [Desulfobulbaceae bacterium]|nr:flavodoxin family protein [Desulfobulbaceae bacterium]